MSDNDTIKAANGGGQLDLRAGGNGYVGISTDGDAYVQSYLYMTPTEAQVGFASGGTFITNSNKTVLQKTQPAFGFMGVDEVGMVQIGDLNTSLGGIFVVDNASGSVTKNAVINPNVGVFLNASGTINLGVDNTAALGGIGYTIKTSYAAYANKISFQANGNAYDTLVVPSAATADRTQTLQDKSGTIALTSDITDKQYETTVNLTANTPLSVTHSLNSNKIIVQLWASDGSIPDVGIIRTSVNAISLESTSSLSNIEVLVYALT
jgi:hypothetical protein